MRWVPALPIWSLRWLWRILSPPFSIRLSPSQNHGFCVCGQNTRISTVPTCGIGLPFRSVWLFNTLFKRSKTHGRIFDFPSLKNRFPTKRAVCFSLLRFLLSVSYLLFFSFLLFTDFLRLCRFWKSVYFLFLFCPSVCRGCFPFGFNSTLKQIFQTAKYFFSSDWKNSSKMRVNARARGLFLFNWKSTPYKKEKFFSKKI